MNATRRAMFAPPRALIAQGPRRLRGVAIALAVAGLLLFATAGLALYVRGGGPLPGWAGFLRPSDRAVLEPSSPAEVVLRTLRLAGYERAVVGDSDGTVVVRVEVPDVASPADIALTWQTAMAAAATSYAGAKTIVVQVFSGSQALLEVSAPAADVRLAIQDDETKVLERATRFRYLSEAGGD